MKGISGIIGGAVLILVLIVMLSLVLASLHYLYGIQQLEMRQALSEVSQPHVIQISSWSVESSGELYATYVIYPNGKVEKINEIVSGIRNFQDFLNRDPWAIIVFSNGQWVNVSNTWNAGHSGFGIMGTGSYLVPYFPGSILPSNPGLLEGFLEDGVSYNIPLYSPVNVTETYNGFDEGTVTVNPSDPLVFGLGRILAVPVTSESGWLNFTITDVPSEALWNGQTPVSFAIIVQNASGPLLDIIYFVFCYWPIYKWHGQFGTFTSWAYNFTYGIYQAWTNPSSPPPPGYNASWYQMYPFMYANLSYSFSNKSFNGGWLLERLTGTASHPLLYDPIIKVAVRFTPGEPAEMYLCIGNYNGSGFSWYKVILPTSEAPVGSIANVSQVFIWSGAGLAPIGMYYNVSWPDVTNTWPVNLYTEASGSPENIYLEPPMPKSIYLEPLVPRLGSTIEVVPYTNLALNEGTVIVNVTYTI